jgi:tRNA 2-thiouridine synthesizing protein A
MANASYDALIDARGLNCPLPLVKARQALMLLPKGARICVLATDPAAPRDFEEFAEVTGHELAEQRVESGTYLLVVVKGGKPDA